MDRTKLATTAVKAAEKLRTQAQLSSISVVDPIEVATEVCKCKVVFQALPTLEGMYSPEPRPTIIIGSERPPGRQMFTCAHELAHHIFGHGASIDELGGHRTSTDPKEFLADMFAGYFLMPQIAVGRALRDRGLAPSSLTPEQVYMLSNYFGVGYSSLITHLTFSLKLLQSGHADRLKQIQPKTIKANYGIPAESTAYFVDHLWKSLPVNAAVGDFILIPNDCEFELSNKLELVGRVGTKLVCTAIAPGYARAMDKKTDWAVHIRVSRKNYEGLARYRFMEEEE